MPLLKNRAVVTDDAWVFVKDEDALPAGRDVVVSLTRFKGEADALASHQGRVGVQIEPTEVIDDVYPTTPPPVRQRRTHPRPARVRCAGRPAPPRSRRSALRPWSAAPNARTSSSSCAYRHA